MYKRQAVRTIGYLTRGTLVFFWIACCLAFLYSATKVRTFRDLFVLFLKAGVNLEANVDQAPQVPQHRRRDLEALRSRITVPLDPDLPGNVSLMALRDRPRETQANAGTSVAAVNPSADLRVEYIGSAKDFKRTVMEAFQAANHDTKIMMQVYHFDCPVLLEACLLYTSDAADE